MDPLKLQHIADAVGGRLVRGDPGIVARGVSTDSRTLAPGQLFVALKGERFDGHAFLDAAANRGAAAAIVNAGAATTRRIGSSENMSRIDATPIRKNVR